MTLLRWTLFAAILTACSGPADDGKDTDARDTDAAGDDTDDTQTSDPPAAPSDLNPQATSVSTVHLTWTDNAVEHDEFRVEAREGTAPFAQVASGADAVADLTGLTPGADVAFRVRTCLTSRCSAYSDEATITMPVGAVPAAPDELTVITLGTTSLGLDWKDNATDETGYVISWSIDGGRTFEDYPVVAAGTQSADDGGLAPNTEYCYRVWATGPNGDSPPSNTACGTTDALTAPQAPLDVTATLSRDTEILLTWTNPDLNDGYKIYESVNAGAYVFSGTVAPGNLAGAFIDQLAAGTRYSYKVVATNGIGDSAQSAASNVVTTPAAPVPTATRFVNASAYPIVSLTLDGVEQFPSAPLGIPPGASITFALAAGAHGYTAQNGFWDGASRNELYTFSGQHTQFASQTGTVTLNNPTMPQLLTRFATSGSYTGEYWSGTTLNYKTLRFFGNGTYNYYDNGALIGTGAVSLVSYPGSFLVTFQITGAQTAQGVLDERIGTFFMRNGPADWPTLQYGYDGP